MGESEKRSERSDMGRIHELFDGVRVSEQKTLEGIVLKESADYKSYAQKVADVLKPTERKIFLQDFVCELLNSLSSNLTSKEYQEIHNKCSVLLNQKQKEEKGPGNKNKKKAPIANVSDTNAKKITKVYDDDEDDEDIGYKGKFNAGDDFM
eukprot:TRINITY_DN1420_c0_g1_i2.p1 TRINITY_DN1420_c0_g1~~TRINITY_DN1420_c0_g1_i2.p1  ORF type:complete len:151 (-),score=47.93 TRINITY_DN1420_c0_g1_i2:139-591(-)